MIAHSDRTKLRQLFADRLVGAVRVVVRIHAGECSLCARAEDVLRETAALSDRLTLVTEIETGEGPLPRIRLEGVARREVGFVGLPSGYEFPSFIDAIIDVSRGTTSLSADALERLAALGHRVHIQVFTTPT